MARSGEKACKIQSLQIAPSNGIPGTGNAASPPAEEGGRFRSPDAKTPAEAES